MRGSTCCRCEDYFPDYDCCDISLSYEKGKPFHLIGGYGSCIDMYEYVFTDEITTLTQLHDRFPFFSDIQITTRSNSSILGGDDNMICDKCFEKMVWYREVKLWSEEHETIGARPGIYPYFTDCCGKMIANDNEEVYKLWTKKRFPYAMCYILTDISSIMYPLNYTNLFKTNYFWNVKTVKEWMKERSMICAECVKNIRNELFLLEHDALHEDLVHDSFSIPLDKLKYFLKALIWKQFHVRQLKLISKTMIALPKDVQNMILLYIMKLIPYPISKITMCEYIKTTLRSLTENWPGTGHTFVDDGIYFSDDLSLAAYQPSCADCSLQTSKACSYFDTHVYKSDGKTYRLYHKLLYDTQIAMDGKTYSIKYEDAL
jgi:hypothetical protein